MVQFYDPITWLKKQTEFFVNQLLPSVIRFVQLNVKKSIEQQTLHYEFLDNFVALVLDLQRKLQSGQIQRIANEELYKNDGFASLAGINLYRNGVLKVQIRFPWPEHKQYFIYTGVPYVWVLELDDDPIYIDNTSLRLHLGGIKFNLLTNKVESRKFKTPFLLAFAQDKLNELVPELRIVPESKIAAYKPVLEKHNYEYKTLLVLKRNDNVKKFGVFIHRNVNETNALPLTRPFLKVGQTLELDIPTIEFPWEVLTILAFQLGIVEEEELHSFPKDFAQMQAIARYSFALASLADLYRDFDPTDITVRRVVSYQFFLARELEKVLYSFVRKQSSKFSVHTNLCSRIVIHRCFNYEMMPNPWSVIRLHTSARVAYEISEKQHQISLTHYGRICPVDTPDKEPGQVVRLTPDARLSLLGKFDQSFIFRNLDQFAKDRLQYYNIPASDLVQIPFEEEELLYF